MSSRLTESSRIAFEAELADAVNSLVASPGLNEGIHSQLAFLGQHLLRRAGRQEARRAARLLLAEPAPSTQVGGAAVAPQPPARRGVHAGVRVGWLKQWAKKVPAGMSTLDVMLNYIKPETKEKFCRYVEIIAEQTPGDVGKAEAFISHTWKAPFRDLVSALAAYLSDGQYVWVDVSPAAPRHLPRILLSSLDRCTFFWTGLRRAPVERGGRPAGGARRGEEGGPRLCLCRQGASRPSQDAGSGCLEAHHRLFSLRRSLSV